MTWTPHTPRHLSNVPADKGVSDATAYYVARHATAPTHVGTYADGAAALAYTDPWAGNPDTDKHWGKNR